MWCLDALGVFGSWVLQMPWVLWVFLVFLAPPATVVSGDFCDFGALGAWGAVGALNCFGCIRYLGYFWRVRKFWGFVVGVSHVFGVSTYYSLFVLSGQSQPP